MLMRQGEKLRPHGICFDEKAAPALIVRKIPCIRKTFSVPGPELYAPLIGMPMILRILVIIPSSPYCDVTVDAYIADVCAFCLDPFRSAKLDDWHVGRMARKLIVVQSDAIRAALAKDHSRPLHSRDRYPQMLMTVVDHSAGRLATRSTHIPHWQRSNRSATKKCIRRSDPVFAKLKMRLRRQTNSRSNPDARWGSIRSLPTAVRQLHSQRWIDFNVSRSRSRN
jgi:hypothetical protein